MYRTFDPGLLRQQLTVYSLGTTDRGDGGSKTTLTSLGVKWAYVQQEDGQRADEFAQIYEGDMYTVIMRYDTASAYKPQTHQFVFGSTTLVIHAVDNFGQRNHFLKFTCASKK